MFPRMGESNEEDKAMRGKRIVIVCLWLLFVGNAAGQKNAVERITEELNKILYGEPCEVPSASDYQIASEPEDEEPVQGFWEHLRHLNRVQARARVRQYPYCLAEQERKLIELRTELVKAQIEAIRNDTRKPPTRRSPTRRSSGDAHYRIDLGLVLDFEDTRKLIEQCAVLGRLEVLRGPLESATDLEQLRATLESYGIVGFRGCPSGVTGSGIVELLGEASKPRTLNEDDFGFIPNPQSNPKTPKPRILTEEDFQPRVFSEEDFADAPLEKEPERIIDGKLYDARARNRTLGGSWYRVEVEFDGDEIIIYFTRHGLGRVHLTLDDEEIDDPSDIDARDRERGNRWTIDVDGLEE